jgi:hypothetical protein
MQIAKVGSVNRGRKQVLFNVGGSNAIPGPYTQRPAMCGSTFIDDCTFHARIERADEQRQRASTRMAGACDATFVDLRPCFQIIDCPHAVPDPVMSQVFAHEQQHLSRHGMLVR